MADFEDLVRTIVTMLDPDEQDRLREMEDWIIKNEGTWVLAEGFNSFLGRVLHDKALPSDGRVAMLRLLAYGAAQVWFMVFQSYCPRVGPWFTHGCNHDQLIRECSSFKSTSNYRTTLC